MAGWSALVLQLIGKELEGFHVTPVPDGRNGMSAASKSPRTAVRRRYFFARSFPGSGPQQGHGGPGTHLDVFIFSSGET